MREKVTQLTQDAACMACHGVINALGFPLEHYDAVGKWRTHEKDTPIDARSIYETDEGVTFSFSSAWDVAQHAIERSRPTMHSLPVFSINLSNGTLPYSTQKVSSS